MPPEDPVLLQHLLDAAHAGGAAHGLERDRHGQWGLRAYDGRAPSRLVTVVRLEPPQDHARVVAGEARVDPATLRRKGARGCRVAHGGVEPLPRREPVDQSGDLVRGDQRIRESRCHGVRPGDGCAGHGEVGTELARCLGQPPAARDVGEEADRGLGHGQPRALGGEAQRAVRRHPDSPAHDDAVHERHVRLGVGSDRGVDLVLVVPEDDGVVAAGHRRLPRGPHVAAGAEPLGADTLDADADDLVIRRPVPQLLEHRVDHRRRERVDGPGSVEQDPAEGPAPLVEDLVGVPRAGAGGGGGVFRHTNAPADRRWSATAPPRTYRAAPRTRRPHPHTTAAAGRQDSASAG